ncbi:MAG: NmrA/HSCARG family protein [Gemmatimonadota bacterium]|nr:NmrA/HSCARG family protein [Gemmatimonadota bacterium]MDH3421518.1 NmrA/HSCARG family protein [Gemmatimonadota bacterium]
MPDKKIIAVLGATGAQGGGLARAILADPDGGFALRAITRNPGSDKAKALAAAGAEVVAADLDDEASLRRAFDGAYGAYCVTNFWEHFSPDKEIAQGRNLAQAAKAAGLQHVVWSTFEDVREFVPLEDDRMPTLQGRFKVPHFDAKAEANAFFKEAGVPTTYLYTSFYWDNFIHFGSEPQRGEDGKLALVIPMGDKKLPGIAAEDIGKCAYGIFREGTKHVGKTIGVAGEHLTGTEMAAELSKALGEEVTYYAMPWEQYRALGFPGADDLGNMMQFKHDFQEDYLAARDLAVARRLNPELQTLSQWLVSNGSAIPRH